MARDFDYSKAGLDRCKYYKGIKTDTTLTRSVEPEGVFYSRDYKPYSVGFETNASDTQVIVHRVELETKDYVSSLTVDDYVLYDNDYWIVEGLDKADIADNAKEFTKHGYATIIRLRR